MAVRLRDELSTWEPVLLPQGSILGPQWFLLFINNMLAITTNITTLFADDSKLIGNARSTATFQSDWNTLLIPVGWCVANEIYQINVQHGGSYTLASGQKGKRSCSGCFWAGDTLCWEEQIWRMIGKTKQFKWRHGSLGMLYLGNQKC